MTKADLVIGAMIGAIGIGVVAATEHRSQRRVPAHGTCALLGSTPVESPTQQAPGPAKNVPSRDPTP